MDLRQKWLQLTTKIYDEGWKNKIGDHSIGPAMKLQPEMDHWDKEKNWIIFNNTKMNCIN